jgi:hypothetical protein
MNPNKALWEKGDFPAIASFIRESGETVVEYLGVKPPPRGLDLGCGDGIAAGTRAIIRHPKLLPARWQITELEEGRSFSWTRRRPGILVTARHSIEDAAEGSRVTLSLDFSGPLPFCVRLTRGLNARYLAVEARGLTKRADADARSQVSKDHSLGGSR